MEEQDSRQYLASKVHPIFEKILIELLITKPDDPVEFMSKWLMTTGQQFRPQEKQHVPFSNTLPVQQQQQQGGTPRRSVVQSLQNPVLNRQTSNKPEQIQNPLSNQPQSSQRDSLKLSQQMNPNLQQALEQSDMQQKHSLDDMDNQFDPPHLGPHDQPSPSPIVPQQKETVPIFQKQQSLLPNTTSYNNKMLKKSQTQNNSQFLVPIVQKPPHPQNSAVPTPKDQSVQQLKSLADSKQPSSRQLLQQKQEDHDEHPLQQLNSLSSKEQQQSQINLPPQQQEQLLTSQQRLQQQQQQQQQQQSQIQMPKYRVINKNREQKSRIEKKLKQCCMFQDLKDKKDEIIDIIAMAMEEKKYKSNDIVIKQGDDGDLLYLVDQGLLDCTKRPKPNHGEDKFIKSYQPGEMFGEMSLLYNEKRQATITAKTECVLFALDKETFDLILKDHVLNKRQTYNQILENFVIFKNLDPYQRELIAEALIVKNFGADSYVFEQGKKGDYFYLVQEGELKAIKIDNHDNLEDRKEVYTFKEYDYFGELAMLKEQVRQASIYCVTDCTLLCLDRQQFKKLLAPLHELLIRNTERYVHFSYY